MKKLIILGAGGHGREVADFIRDGRSVLDYELLGFIDENQELWGQERAGFPVLGSLSMLPQLAASDTLVLCALGSPPLLRKAAVEVRMMGFGVGKFISSNAVVSSSAQIGEGCLIFPGAVINTNVSLADFVTVNTGATVSHDTVIGAYSNINPGARIAGCARIDEGCFIGMGASVIQGLALGAWSIVGAGAVVVENIPANVTAVGVPAKVIRQNKAD